MKSNLVPGQAENSPERRQCILVVEDEVLIRFMISDALREAGYDVIEAFNGDEAVDLLNVATPVDLILSDVRMPGAIDGLELLKIAKQRLPTVPVILTSGHLDPRVATTEGATHFLPKPYVIDKALGLVRMELKSRK